MNHSVMADLKRFERLSFLLVFVIYIFRTLLKIDYRKYSRYNAGFKYILVIIDAFSRFAYTAPLKFKTAEECANAIDKIFQNFSDVPILFSSDKGNEVDSYPDLFFKIIIIF